MVEGEGLGREGDSRRAPGGREGRREGVGWVVHCAESSMQGLVGLVGPAAGPVAGVDVGKADHKQIVNMHDSCEAYLGELGVSRVLAR